MTTTNEARPPLLQAEGLLVGYHGQPLLPAIEIALRPGEFWLLAGRNGSGKSTLLRTLLGLQPPVGGRVERAEDTRISYLSQRHRADPLMPMRAWDVVAQGVERGWSFLRPWRSAAERARIEGAIELTGIGPLAKRRFTTLSEGQKQRVLLAQAVAAEATLLVLDEPTAAMDLAAEQEMMERLDGLRRNTGVAVLLVSHDLRTVMQRAEQMVFVDADHRHVAIGNVDEVAADSWFRHQFALLPSCGMAHDTEFRR